MITPLLSSSVDTITIKSLGASTGTYYTGINSNMNTSLITNGVTAAWATTTHPTLQVSGDATFDGDLMIKGKRLSETLAGIEARLGILHPNTELEEKWENLKGLGKMYRELEAEILEKEKIWSVLKK